MINIIDIVRQQGDNTWSFKLETAEILLELGDEQGEYTVLLYNEAQGGYDKVQDQLARVIYNEFCIRKVIR